MNVVKCRNGHFFDNSTYEKCPHCGEVMMPASNTDSQKNEKRGFWNRNRNKNDTVYAESSRSRRQVLNEKVTISNTINSEIHSLANKQSDIVKSMEKDEILGKDATLNFWQVPSSSSQFVDDSVEAKVTIERVNNAEISLSEKGDNTSPTGSLMSEVKKISASTEGKTMSYFSAASNDNESSSVCIEPVVGWLVALSGKHYGESFCIHAGQNSIGRGADNDIVVGMDSSISRVKHALIVYEPKKRRFYLQPGASSGLTYLNDEYITESKQLEKKDVIELGESKLLFIPLCDCDFTWEDQKKD